VHLYDVAAGKLTKLHTAKGKLADLAWNRDTPVWVAAAFADGTLWRKNLATGAEVVADANVTPSTFLQVTRGGTVLFAEGRMLRAWRPNGSIDPHAELPRPIIAIGRAGAGHIFAVLADFSTYLVDLAAPNSAQESENLSGQLDARNKRVTAAMAADAGTFVAPNNGGLEIVDPLARHRWILTAQPPPPNLYDKRTTSYRAPMISVDGTRVIATLPNALVAWSIKVPASGDETVAWIETLTNATLDAKGSGKLGWR
jgi:hypothetical protein